MRNKQDGTWGKKLVDMAIDNKVKAVCYTTPIAVEPENVEKMEKLIL